MPPRHLLPLALLPLLPSCAYMQTHKNVEELGRTYQGYQLEKPRQLYRSGHTWYVAATPTEFRLTYPSVHDKVLRDSNAPQMTPLQPASTTPAYHSLSPHTATVLLRADGYADQESLAGEISRSSDPWLTSLPGASTHTVQAHIAGAPTTPITYDPTPAELPFRYRFLSGLDLVFIDAPGTLAYNIAVPFFLPFVFFYDFLNE